MPQEVGVRSTFLTAEFTRGLSRYLAGISQAIAATNQMVAAINNLGAQSSAVFATLQSNANATANAMRALANATRAAQRAINPTRRQARGQTQAAATGNINTMMTGAGARAAQNTTAQINAAATATRNLGTQARQTTINLNSLNASTVAVGTAIGTVAGQAIVGLARGLASLTGKVIEIVTFFERMELSIAFFTARSIQAEDATVNFNEALAQGERQAQGLSIWLQRLAVSSPFTTRTVATIFRTAQAYGLTRKEAEQLTPLLLDFGAAAGLDRDILERLALAIGQIRSRGKLTGEEVRQLGNSGLPVRDILVKALNIANSEFDELLESGALTTNVVIPHLIDALRNFEGAGARVAFGTIGGIVSAMEELQEISTAKFFIGFLEPLKQSLQDLFAVLNRPEVLAFVQILGEELGGKFKQAVLGLVATLKSYLAAWQDLNPAVKQQIVVFAGVTAGVFAMAAAFGIMTLALGILTNPLVLIATTIGFLVSEWTSGFAVLSTITRRVATAIGNALMGMVRTLAAALRGFGDFAIAVTGELQDLEDSVARFGMNIGISLANGITASSGVLVSALRGIGSLLSFWLAPGSPPRVAPELDEWGKASMEEYIAAFGQANVRKALGNGMSIVSDSITDELIRARREAVDRLNAAHPDLNLTLAQDLQQVVEEGYAKVETAIADTGAVESEATAAGIRVSDAFVNSFLSRIPALTPRMSDELQKVMNQIGSGTRLSLQGALTFGRFLQGFADADFSVLDETTNIVQGFFQSLVDAGQIEEIDLPRMLFGAREALARGIQDIARVGEVTRSTLQTIRATAGGASTLVLQLLNAYRPLVRANEDVEQAQDKLNAVTEKYKGIITPLRKELEAINEANRMASDEEKILSLRRLIANEGVSDRRRRNARLEIDQIIAEQRLRGLEAEREAATETAEDELDAREKVQENLQEQFDDLQRNIQAQMTQIGLFGQEASIIKRLREEAEKLREKELTQEDLQLKFIEFQNEEMKDLIEAARAKYDLDRADSTELEKQQAQITLAEIALRRRNREAEAIKLGIPVEELTKLRDFEVTLDDLGVKAKDAFAFEGVSNLGDSIVDADAITKEWEKTLAQVRDRWTEIKNNISETAAQIDASLPSFLKIFPQEIGEEPPIITFIKRYTGVLVGLAVAMTTFKIVARIAALIGAIRGLMGIGAAAGAATAAGGGAAAGGFLAGVVGSILAIATAAGTAVLAINGLMAALKLFGTSEEGRFEESTKAIDTSLGNFGPQLAERTSKLIQDVGIQTGAARAALAENVTTAATLAIQDGFGDEHVSASIGNALNRAIAEGVIADTPENRAAIAAFQANILEILKLDETTTPLSIFENVPLDTKPSAIQQQQAKDDMASFLAGIVDKNQAGAFALNIKDLVEDATRLGMDRAQVDQLVFGAFNEGVKNGLIADTPSNRDAITKYVNGIIAKLKKEGEIDSPSKLTHREIGQPLGQGILSGIQEALTVGTPTLVSTSNLMFDELEKSFKAGETALVTIANTIRTSVVSAFTLMRTLTEAQAMLMRTNILKIFAGEETSLLPQLVKVLLGDAKNNVPQTIGKNFMLGIAKGITDNKQKLADAMTNAMVFALGQAKDSMEIASPSARAAREIGVPYAQGVAEGILQGMGSISNAARFALANAVDAPLQARFGAQPSRSAATTTNISRSNHYYLNVKSSMNSQGIASDFGIMRTLGGV